MLHSVTPLIPSPGLSRRSGCQVYLKLDALQPSGSFKTRGVGAEVAQLVDERGKDAHLVCSSGGNAGLACAYAAKKLGAKCSIFVPMTTSADMILRLQALGAQVVQGGVAWHEADAAARKLVASDANMAYVHPFDHPAVANGNSTVVSETAEQLQQLGISAAPDAIICSVGGGGLLTGVLQGVSELPWPDTSIIAAETYGAASLYASLVASYTHRPPRADPQTLDAIRTIAITLGATRVSDRVINAALARDAAEGAGKVCGVRVEDAATVAAISMFLDEHFILVEPSCSASFVPLMVPTILQKALSPAAAAKIGHADESERPVIVVVVCGGNGAPLATLLEWRERFDLKAPTEFGQTPGEVAYAWSVCCGARGVEAKGKDPLL